MIRAVYPGSGSQIQIMIFIFYPSRIPDSGVKKAPDPGSGTLLRTIIFSRFLQVCIVNNVTFKASAIYTVKNMNELRLT
jgi:hypothetical protein